MKLPRKLLAFVFALAVITVVALHAPTTITSVATNVAALYASFVAGHQHAEHLASKQAPKDEDDLEAA